MQPLYIMTSTQPHMRQNRGLTGSMCHDFSYLLFPLSLSPSLLLPSLFSLFLSFFPSFLYFFPLSKRCCQVLGLFLFFFLTLPCSLLGSPTRDWTWPREWKYWVLITGLPGEFPQDISRVIFLFINYVFYRNASLGNWYNRVHIFNIWWINLVDKVISKYCFRHWPF